MATEIAAEAHRIHQEYDRREREVCGDRYALWQPAERLMRCERSRWAATLLRQSGAFPRAGDACLEIGYGRLGWLAELIAWGANETDLHGIELDARRARSAQSALPMADLRIGDATRLPWADESFQLVVASTVFSSILHDGMRRLIADEITRVLRPGGALLWYDLAVGNPKNPHVRPLPRPELVALFPQLRGTCRSVTLAPPLARWTAPRSWLLATALQALPFLRTHWLAILVKQLPAGVCSDPAHPAAELADAPSRN